MARTPPLARPCRAALCALILAAAPAASRAQPALQLSAEYASDLLANVRGGLGRGERFLDKFQVAAGLTFETATGDEGALYVAAHHLNGGALSAGLVGDAHGVSNIEGPGGAELAEAWAYRTFAGGRAGLKAGVIDLNAEFDVQDVGALFLTSSHGVGAELAQTGANGPSIFPMTGLGLTLFVEPAETWTVRAGLFEADPSRRGFDFDLSQDEGALVIAELERRFGETTARIGAWRYTSRFETLGGGRDPPAEARNAGAYALVEWTPPLHALGGPSRAWIRFGVAEARVNPIAWYAGGGVVRTGVWAEDDRLGLAIAHAAFGGPGRRVDGLGPSETVVELTYDRALDARVRFQPVLQFVRNPGGGPGLRDAVVGGVRLTLSWERP